MSDFTVKWTSADFDPACGNISYYVTLTGSSDESNKEDFIAIKKYMNFTGLNDTEYHIRVHSISSVEPGDAVTQRIRTVDSSSASPSSKLKI